MNEAVSEQIVEEKKDGTEALGGKSQQQVRLSLGYDSIFANKLQAEARGDRGLRDRALRRSRSRSRSWSRSPARNGTGTSKRTRSPPKAPRTGREPTNRPPPNGSNVASKRHAPAEDKMDIDSRINGIKGSEDEDNDEDALLRKMMGFSTFNTTHDKKVPGNNVSGVRKEKSTKYRQYMNRTGGFNRPLSPSRD